MKRMPQLVVSLVLLAGVFLVPGKHVFGSGGTASEIKLGLEPSETAFTISNMKPGDWATRTFRIRNNSTKDFYYTATLENTGEAALFRQLSLEIHDADGNELYQGSLSAFHQLASRNLNVSEEEALDFTVRFPAELGNEYQSLEAAFMITFTAEGRDNLSNEDFTGEGQSPSDGSGQHFMGEGELPSNGSILPNTATNLFLYLFTGMVFLLIGSVILLYQKRKHWRESCR